jgi:lipopolysaccharide export system permease protein
MLALPVATLVIILFGAPLATSYKRGGAAFGVGISLVTVIAFIAMLKLAQALGEAGALSPWAAAWTPNLVFGSAALVLLTRVRT